MVYQKKFVVAVKCDRRILREQDGDTVSLPFGSEYSILLKNLNTRKALVKVEVDGKSIGKDIILDSNTGVELERFTENLDKGYKFRFIKKTDEIVEHRGDHISDGQIRVEYQFEKPKHEVVIHQSYDYDYHYPHCTKRYFYSPLWCEPDSTIWFSCTTRGLLSSSIKENEGITVKGSDSNQKFVYGSIGELEENSEIIIINLKGYRRDGKTEISEPITINSKRTCEICGFSTKENYKFCPKCSTRLSL